MNVFIAGADGMIGSALARMLATSGRTLFTTTRRRDSAGPGRIFLDLSQDPAGLPLPDSVSVAYLCAGATSVEACEKDPASTGAVNVTHTLTLARRLIERNARVVYFSTNIVFDGTKPFAGPDDEPRPRSEYGRQKLAVEQSLLRTSPESVVVRLTKVLGPRPAIFMEWMRRLRVGETVEPFRDKVMAPVPLPFVIEALGRLLENRLGGILQISGPRDVTYDAIAYRLAERIGAAPGLIRPITGRGTRLAPDLAPAHTTLDTRRLQADLGMVPPDAWPTIEWSLT